MEVSPRENTCVVIDIPDSYIVSHEGHTACTIVDLSESWLMLLKPSPTRLLI